MTRNDFLIELQEIMQLDDPIAEDADLRDYEEWDSLAFMVLITFFDKNFGQRITFEDLAVCETPLDIMELSKGAIS
ncbi:MAG: phosphopantetheine-binding protein [Desulfovibrio sp.]|nr:phosphopantetheine-binding protein [Desulfovibrio sp.]